MLYTIDNLDAVGSHVITLPTDSIVYLGIKSDLMFPGYFSLSNELNDNPQNGRALVGHQENPYWGIPVWRKDYVIGHFWTGNEPCDIAVSHELSGYVPEYGPVEREVTRYSLTLSGENGEADKTYLYDVLSVGRFYGNSTCGIMVRDEDENALGYAAYIYNQNVYYKQGARLRQAVGYGIVENTIIKFDDDVLFPNIFIPAKLWFHFNGSSYNLSATSLGTVTIQDFPIAEYKPVAPKKIDINLKVEEKSYAYIYHPAVSGGE